MATVTSKPCVFISYRQEDSGGWAGRLEDDLADRFGTQRVFRDVKLPFGVDYQDHIERTLDSVRVVVVVIGPSWTTVKGADGTPRLEQPDDLLRREIERALERRDVDVIPVLVQRARMPAPHELPPSVRALARRQAIELSDARWSHDMGQLIAHLCEVLDDTSAVRPVPPPPPRPDDRRERGGSDDGSHEHGPRTTNEWLIAAGAMLAATVLGVLISSRFTESLAERRVLSAPEIDRIVYYAAERAVVWAIVGALVLAAAAATLRRDRASALGWAVLGLGFGAVAGALGGAAYMALKDQELLTNAHLLRGVAAGVVGFVLAGALARLVSGDRTIYKLAGLAGGVLGGILAQSLLYEPGSARSVSMVMCEAVVMTAALAAVATTVPSSFAARGRVPART